MRPASFVLLTQGDRPLELVAAVESIVGQRDVEAEIVIVSNGAGPIDVPAHCKLVVSRENLGIPGGRNLGAANSSHDAIFFVDDDAYFAADDAAVRALDELAARPDVGVVSFRLRDPESGHTERRHVPRIRVGDPAESFDATVFLGGACVIRRTVFEKCGPYPAHFFYSHEETDLAWRAIDAGFAIRYRGDIELMHPAVSPSRHPEYHFRSARNRVWLARRRLPLLLVAVHSLVTSVRGLAQAGTLSTKRDVLRGIGQGWRATPGKRAPMRWATAWRLTRLGRPPVV